MQRLGGTLLLLAGSALGGYAFLPTPPDGAARLAEVTRISAAPDRDARSQATSAGPALAIAPAQATTAASNGAATGALAVAATVPAPAQSPSTWSTVVTAETDNSVKLKSPKPGDDETRAGLTRDLQRELQRVGCYGGDITGSWTPSTKKAMSAFMDRVNATLPVEEPDYILLTLVQGHKTEACGASCPSGQSLDAGRCVPNAVIAKAARKQKREEERRLAELQKAEQQQRIAAELRNSEQKRVADARRSEDARAESARIAAAAVKAANENKQRGAAAQPPATETLPWLDTKHQESQVAVAAPVNREPLPGRMSVGAPLPTGPDRSTAIAAVTTNRDAAPIIPLPDPSPDNQWPGNTNAEPDGDTSVGPAVNNKPRLPGVLKPAVTETGSPARQPARATYSATYRAKRSFSKAYADDSRPRAKVRTASAGKRQPVTVYSGPKVTKKYVYFAANKPQRAGGLRPGTAGYYVMRSLGGGYY